MGQALSLLGKHLPALLPGALHGTVNDPPQVCTPGPPLLQELASLSLLIPHLLIFLHLTTWIPRSVPSIYPFLTIKSDSLIRGLVSSGLAAPQVMWDHRIQQGAGMSEPWHLATLRCAQDGSGDRPPVGTRVGQGRRRQESSRAWHPLSSSLPPVLSSPPALSRSPVTPL